MRKLLATALLLLVAFAGGASAAPGTIADCEKLGEAHAYNFCLASFGPKRGAHPASSHIAPRTRKRQISGQQALPAFAGGKRDASGRVTMVFDVGRRKRR